MYFATSGANIVIHIYTYIYLYVYKRGAPPASLPSETASISPMAFMSEGADSAANWPSQ